MLILFIRHAEAVEAEDFTGDDLNRPLTSAGRKSARAAFKRLAAKVEAPDLIVTSEAVRARETANILAKVFGHTAVATTALLNPGARPKALKKMLSDLPKSVRTLMLVGHEPDFSRMVSALVARGELAIKLKKAGCIAVELETAGRGSLLFALPPRMM